KTSTNKIHEKTGIERRNIYDILNKLIERGFVTYIDENKRRTFHLSNPKKILSYIEEKKDILNNIKNKVSDIMPDILSRFESKKPDIKAEVYRGIEGIKAVWEDTLNYKVTYWIGSGRYVPRRFPDFFNNWNKRRISKKIVWFNLHRIEMKKEIKQFQFEHLRFLPKEFSANPVVICIYGNKVVQFLYGETLFAFLIESKELSENYKAYHKFLWDNVAKK
ncbi:hypothetical protein HYW75_04325, partial [Candidatus Pacearchaeota archaeon]|nr:hypothetical protein [Candidatus Pacearchaeota archaeon]